MWIDLITVLVRLIIILPFLWLILLFMGQRSMNRLGIFDFMIVLLIGSLVGADLADPHIVYWPTLIALTCIALLQKTAAICKMKWQQVRKVANFEPLLVIFDGKMLSERLLDVQYSPDNILELLREQSIFSVNDVYAGYVENSGSLSIVKQSARSTFFVTVVMEKRIIASALDSVAMSLPEFKALLATHELSVDELLYCGINEAKQLEWSRYGEAPSFDPALQ
ncbi:uncharacterized protein DUF421 [Aureibacillus halotolerans]|uniref:Uncharacterized protein DUF421 n=2 Tax=Aureibacillus halotolerans TaxID=1508390 RepID=A0A4R6U6I0_9BACI|nr:uncharacterized protein DUF421 [Aureibacillus halotolerans]